MFPLSPGMRSNHKTTEYLHVPASLCFALLLRFQTLLCLPEVSLHEEWAVRNGNMPGLLLSHLLSASTTAPLIHLSVSLQAAGCWRHPHPGIRAGNGGGTRWEAAIPLGGVILGPGTAIPPRAGAGNPPAHPKGAALGFGKGVPAAGLPTAFSLGSIYQDVPREIQVG